MEKSLISMDRDGWREIFSFLMASDECRLAAVSKTMNNFVIEDEMAWRRLLSWGDPKLTKQLQVRVIFWIKSTKLFIIYLLWYLDDEKSRIKIEYEKLLNQQERERARREPELIDKLDEIIGRILSSRNEAPIDGGDIWSISNATSKVDLVNFSCPSCGNKVIFFCLSVLIN